MTKKLQQTLLPIKLEQSEEKLTSLAGLVVVEELAVPTNNTVLTYSLKQLNLPRGLR